MTKGKKNAGGEGIVALLLQAVLGKSGNWGREGRREYDQADITAQLYSHIDRRGTSKVTQEAQARDAVQLKAAGKHDQKHYQRSDGWEQASAWGRGSSDRSVSGRRGRAGTYAACSRD